MLFALIIFCFNSTFYNLYSQDKECWEYNAKLKTYFTSARDNEILEENRTIGPFSSEVECQSRAAKNSGSESYDSWILEKREWTPGKCVRCSGSENKDNAKGFENRNRTLEQDHLNQVLDNQVMSWYKNIINSVNASNIVNLLGSYAGSVPLQTLGTAMGAYSVAKAYIELFEFSSESAINKAMGLLKLSENDRQQFMTASGAYIMSKPDIYFKSEDPDLIKDAFIMSAGYSELEVSNETIYFTSALFAVAGLVAAETGNDDESKTLLASSLIMLTKLSDVEKGNNISNLVQRTNSSFSLNMDVTNYPGYSEINNKKTLDISGEYDCIYPQGVAAGTFNKENGTTETRSLLKVRQTGNDLYFESSSSYIASARSTDSYTFSGSTMVTKSEGHGTLNVKEANTVWTTTTNYSGGSTTTHFMSQSKTNSQPAKSTTSQSQSKLRVLENGDLEFSSIGSDGVNHISKFRKK